MRNLPKSPLQWHSLTLNNFCHSYFVFKRGSTEGSFSRVQNPIKLLTFKVSGLIFGHFFLCMVRNSMVAELFSLCKTIYLSHTHVPLPPSLAAHAQLGSQQELMHIMHAASFMQGLHMSKHAQGNAAMDHTLTAREALSHITGTHSNYGSDKHTAARADWIWQLLCVMLLLPWRGTCYNQPESIEPFLILNSLRLFLCISFTHLT